MVKINNDNDKGTDDTFEIFYRRMSNLEGLLSREKEGLVEGRAEIIKGNQFHRSEPHKWVAANPNYALRYRPRESKEEDYPIIAVIHTAPGTHDALLKLKTESKIRRGKGNTFGITPEFIEWFNNRIFHVEFYDLREGRPELPKTQSSIQYLMRGGNYVVFQAFSPEYIGSNAFTDSIKLTRMSWLKTSLLWTLFRSDWGRKKGQEVVIEVSTPPGYLAGLEERAVPTKESNKEDEVIRQVDPDRAIIGRWWSDTDEYWVKARRTSHLGIRGEEFREYVFDIVPGNLRDITDIVQNIEKERPVHPTSVLYEVLSYTPVPKIFLR